MSTYPSRRHPTRPSVTFVQTPPAAAAAATASSSASVLPPIHSAAAAVNPTIVGDLGRAYDFEVRSSLTGPSKSPSTSSLARLATVPGFTSLQPQPVKDTAARARKRPGAVWGEDQAKPASSSSSTLPSHLQTTSEKIDFFLNWNKGLGDEGVDGETSGTQAQASLVSGVLTPRTRYDRLAQSVAAVPFEEAKEREMMTPTKFNGSLSQSSSQASLFNSPFNRSTSFQRTPSRGLLSPSVSSPSLLASSSTSSPTRTLAPSLSHSSLHQGQARDASQFVPPSEFLARFMPESLGVASAVSQENERAKELIEKFQLLLSLRKARKREKKGPSSSSFSSLPKTRAKRLSTSSLTAGGGSAKDSQQNSASDSDSDSDDLDDPFASLSSHHHPHASLLPKRKPGTQSGAQIFTQIQTIVRTVQEEKEAMLAGVLGEKSKEGANKKRAGGDRDSDEEEGPAKGKKAPSAVVPMTTAEEEAQLQSVIQAYMDATGLAGSVLAGGASSGSGVIKERDGTSTFTTSKITRDVKLVLGYLKQNPIMRQELIDKIEKRQAAKKAAALAALEQDPEAAAAAQAQARSLAHSRSQSKVLANQQQAWLQTEENKERQRLLKLRRHRARHRAQQERKSAIDFVKDAPQRERDAALMHAFGPEMAARRAREVAEAERRAHVQWGWCMFAQLIPITIRFKWKLKEILKARVIQQVEAFLMPTIKRCYVLNMTYKLNESRAAALDVIKRALRRHVHRWKWLKRRNACLSVWKFMTLVKNAYSIRQGLKDSSLRSQIIKIQTWWRANLHVIACQVMLVELAWNRCEALLIKNWARKQKKEERKTALLKNTGGAGTTPVKQRKIIPAHLLGGTASPSASAAARDAKKFPRSHARGVSDFTHTLATFNFNAEDQMERDAAQGLAPKRIPRAQKREILARYVRKRRAIFRAAVRNHVHVLAAWFDEHKHEIELRKARKELGIRGTTTTSSTSTNNHNQRQQEQSLEPPPRPTLKLLPSNSELEHMIMVASKQYVLSKLRGAMSAGNDENGGVGYSTNRSNHANNNANITSRSNASTVGSSEPLTSSSITASSNSFNSLGAFVPGSSHASPAASPLKSLTIGEQMRGKREMLLTTQEGTEDEEEEEEGED